MYACFVYYKFPPLKGESYIVGNHHLPLRGLLLREEESFGFFGYYLMYVTREDTRQLD